MVNLSVFFGMCILLLMVVNTNALDTHYVSLDESGEEIANLSKYNDIELSEEEKREIREKQRSFIVLVGMAVSIFTIFCLTLLVGFYVVEKKREKNEKK